MLAHDRAHARELADLLAALHAESPLLPRLRAVAR
jgi:hypothetical protein